MKCSQCPLDARTIYLAVGVVPIYYCNAHTPIGMPMRLVNPPANPNLQPPPPYFAEVPGDSEVQAAPAATGAQVIDPDPIEQIPSTVKGVLAWVGDDPVRVEMALDREDERETPRPTLIRGLKSIVSEMERA